MTPFCFLFHWLVGFVFFGVVEEFMKREKKKAAICFAPVEAMKGAPQSGQCSHCGITAVRELNWELQGEGPCLTAFRLFTKKILLHHKNSQNSSRLDRLTGSCPALQDPAK